MHFLIHVDNGSCIQLRHVSVLQIYHRSFEVRTAPFYYVEIVHVNLVLLQRYHLGCNVSIDVLSPLYVLYSCSWAL